MKQEEQMDTVATKQTRSGGVGMLMRVPVQLWLVVALMAMSFGAGVLVRTMAEPPSSPVIPQSQIGGQVVAPPLSDQQIEQGLPSGHPTLSDGATAGGGQDGAGGQGGGNGGGNG
jgi:hypothetical protein